MEATLDTPAAPHARNTGVGRTFWLLGAALGLMLLAGIAALAVTSKQRPSSYTPNSPPGVVQRYLTYLQDGNVDQAYALTDHSSTLQGFHERTDNWSGRSHRVTLIRSRITGHLATVTVDISGFSAGPLGTSESTDRTTFTLVRQGKSWRLSDPEYLPY